MLGSNSSISYIVLCNYHSNTSCNHKDTNCKEEPEEPLCIVPKVVAVILLVSSSIVVATLAHLQIHPSVHRTPVAGRV